MNIHRFGSSCHGGNYSKLFQQIGKRAIVYFFILETTMFKPICLLDFIKTSDSVNFALVDIKNGAIYSTKALYQTRIWCFVDRYVETQFFFILSFHAMINAQLQFAGI